MGNIYLETKQNITPLNAAATGRTAGNPTRFEAEPAEAGSFAYAILQSLTS